MMVGIMLNNNYIIITFIIITGVNTIIFRKGSAVNVSGDAMDSIIDNNITNNNTKVTARNNCNNTISKKVIDEEDDFMNFLQDDSNF